MNVHLDIFNVSTLLLNRTNPIWCIGGLINIDVVDLLLYNLLRLTLYGTRVLRDVVLCTLVIDWLLLLVLLLYAHVLLTCILVHSLRPLLCWIWHLCTIIVLSLLWLILKLIMILLLLLVVLTLIYHLLILKMLILHIILCKTSISTINGIKYLFKLVLFLIKVLHLRLMNHIVSL